MTVTAELLFSGLDASSVTDDDVAALKTGIASIIDGVSASDIDNMQVIDASTRRLGGTATSDRRGLRRRLAMAATVAFDVSLSISASVIRDLH